MPDKEAQNNEERFAKLLVDKTDFFDEDLSFKLWLEDEEKRQREAAEGESKQGGDTMETTP